MQATSNPVILSNGQIRPVGFKLQRRLVDSKGTVHRGVAVARVYGPDAGDNKRIIVKPEGKEFIAFVDGGKQKAVARDPAKAFATVALQAWK